MVDTALVWCWAIFESALRIFPKIFITLISLRTLVTRMAFTTFNRFRIPTAAMLTVVPFNIKRKTSGPELRSSSGTAAIKSTHPLL